MKPTDPCPAPPAGRVITCDVLAHASLRLAFQQFPGLRQRPGPEVGPALPANFLKHTDEQTVAALAAVRHAVYAFGLAADRLTDWGVVAAPCFLGRSLLASALQRFAAEGAWGFSPHFIPHRSQHAAAGTISQALKIHGPNFGAGGGPGSVSEALLAGPVLLEGDQLPGVWVVVTDWEPELIPNADGRPVAECTCHAVALALGPARPAWRGLRLRLGREAVGVAKPSAAGPTVSDLATWLARLTADDPPAKAVWHLPSGGWVELGRPGALVFAHLPEASPRPAAGRAGTPAPQAGAWTENQP